MTTYAVGIDDIRAAARRIDGVAHRTPVLTCTTLDGLAGGQLFFKCENLQRVGAFKFRGAYNAVASLSHEQAARGVLTHSSGNHAQALALAARIRGIPAYIVMPDNAPAVKVAAVRGYGAEITPCPPILEEREIQAEAVRRRTGATLIHAYDHPPVIAGQGTVALELVEQVAGLDAVVVPVGGGGLISGITLALRSVAPQIRVFAAEPAGADDAYRSKRAGMWIPQTDPHTVADGLLTSLGTNTWPVVRDLVEAVFTVDEAAIMGATRLVWERMKVVIEPSAAVPLAVVLSERFKELTGLARVGVVFSGGNVDLESFGRLLAGR